MPSEAVAGCDSFNSFVTVVYRQIERIHIRATRARLAVVVGVGARDGVGRTIPRIAVTRGNSVNKCGAMADGQVQGVCASTAVGVDVIIGIRTTRGIVRFMPYIAVTCGDGLGVMSTMSDGEVQCHRAVAPCSIGSGKCRGVSVGIVRGSVPC